MSSRPQYDAFVITAPGLEPLAVAELEALGAGDARVSEGGATFTASRRSLYEANLNLRTASRVVVRAAEFVAKAFHELERRAGRVPWEAFVSPNLDVSLRVTCRKSRLYHSDAVAERVANVIASRVSGVRIANVKGAEALNADNADQTIHGTDRPAPNQLILVRIFHDRCTVSIDSSGALLHLRGYRQAVAKAPMRETLAAAALMASGWRGDRPLMDPMCGSGTISIEGALIARRIAPGMHRRFAFEAWPDFDAAMWREVLAQAESRMLATPPVLIQASDRDAGAVEAARTNAERAGVGADIELSKRSISAVEVPDEPGWIVTNPPYGIRVGEHDALRNLYAQLGNVIRAKAAGWRVALVSADPDLDRQLRLPLESVLQTSNGGIKVRVIAGDVPGPAADGARITRASAAGAQRYPS